MWIALTLASCLCAGTFVPAERDSLSFVEGRTLAGENDAVLLVLVHGSDWNPFGERLFTKFWLDDGFAAGEQLVLADIDVLQSASEDANKANAERNREWKKEECGLRTYPAILAYTPDGKPLGVRQGRDLPRDLEGARATILELSLACRTWLQSTHDLEAARAAKDDARELELLVARDALPLTRASDLLDEVRRLDPQDTAGHLARLTFPHWNELVSKATSEAQAGEGDEAEKRLVAMLANEAYTAEQRAAIHLALGSAYRRWEKHEEQASSSFHAAWRAAPDSVCGHAGRRLYLSSAGGPSIEFGWGERHAQEDVRRWTVEDFPTRLEPGTYRLRLVHEGGELRVTGVQLHAAGAVETVSEENAHLGAGETSHECTFTIERELANTELRISIRRNEKSHGLIEWTRLP